MLPTVTEIGRAFLNGSTVQFRPKNLASDPTAWVDAKGEHQIELDVYDYRVKPIPFDEMSGKHFCSLCGYKKRHGYKTCLRCFDDHGVKVHDYWEPIPAEQTAEESSPLPEREECHMNIKPDLERKIERIPHIEMLARRIERVVVDMAVKGSKTPLFDKLQIRGEAMSLFRPANTADGEKIDIRHATQDEVDREVSRLIESGKHDAAVKDRAIKMAISGALNMDEFGIPLDTMDRIMPAAMEFFKKAVLDGHFDQQVVPRFNDLVKEGNVDIQCDGHLGKTWVSFEEDILYRLRPTPRYRAFNIETIPPLKVLFKKRFRIKDHDPQITGILAQIQANAGFESAEPHLKFRIGNCGYLFSFDEAFEKIEDADTGEPFGMREGRP